MAPPPPVLANPPPPPPAPPHAAVGRLLPSPASIVQQLFAHHKSHLQNIYSGPTVHFVDKHYDKGRTLAQRLVPVLANDTPELLAARVLHEEHEVYVEAVATLCDDRIVWREDGVPLIRSRTNPDEYT